MRKWKAGDRVRRLEKDINNYGTMIGEEYILADVWCPIDAGLDPNNHKNWRVKLVGFNPLYVWDAYRFELIPPYVQACPCGVYWEECSEHG
jgi:hypothetical protein